jgi:hypothetical protein
MITEFKREDKTFVVNTKKGDVKINSALINHPETASNTFKIKLQNGTQLGIYDMKFLSASDVISFNSDGIVKFNVFDMDDKILACENYTINDIENKPIEIPLQVMIDIA